MAVRTCEVCGGSFTQTAGRPAKRCPLHRDTVASERYGAAHQAIRRATLRDAYGALCVRCDEVMVEGQRLHLDHRDGGGPNDYLGWSHAFCNLSAAGRRGAQRQGETHCPGCRCGELAEPAERVEPFGGRW